MLFTRRDETNDVKKLYVLSADTGEERFITDSVHDAGWSPDGRVWVVDMDDKERRLRFFDVESGEESTFGERLYLDGCFASLLWSPDGEQFAYFTGNENELVLKMLNLVDGSNYQVPVTRHEMPQWSPDGNYVLINSSINSTPYRLLAADDGSELLNNLTYAYFSPDSRYLTYTDEANVVWRYELATGVITVPEVPENSLTPLPDSVRYVSPSGVHAAYVFAESLDYGDPENGSLRSVDFGYRIGYAGWSPDERSILLYADYVDFFDDEGPTNDVYYSDDERPTSIFSYDLTSGESTPILTDTAWIHSVNQNGDWTLIRYSSVLPEDRHSPTTHLLIYNSEERIEAELLMSDVYGYYGNGYRWLPGIVNLGEGFLIDAPGGLYRFDTQSASLEAITSGSTSYPFWSAGDDYLAFISTNLNIWSVERETLSVMPSEGGHIKIIGWRDSPVQESLLYCGIG